MLNRFFSRFFDRISLLQAAEATVISFILMSIIGGTVLYLTEMNRIVDAKEAIHATVLVQTTVSEGSGFSIPSRTETHTVVRDVQYKGEKFVDTLFTSVSALCVTGLISTDFSTWSLAGQIVVMILIQMGGLGIILFTSIFAIAIVRGLSERNSFKSILSGVLDTSNNGTTRLIKHIALYTFLFEGLATLIMGVRLQWFVDPGAINNINPWWFSLFHSVSAFNNAGFSLMSNNLMNYVTDPVINFVIAGLIILGGLGYPVLIAIHAYIRSKLLRKDDDSQKGLNDDVKDVIASPVQVRIAIFGTIILLAIGTFLPLITDWDNPILKDLSGWQKFMTMFFQSVSTRTAGFNTVDIGALATATTVLYMLLMFIGANPAGTAGGIKIPTVAVLWGYIKDWFMEPGKPIVVFGRAISKFALSHAIRLVFAVVIFLTFATMLILIQEDAFLSTPDPVINLHKVIFEVVSAFGTVGLSMGFTGGVTSLSAILAPFSKYMLMLIMLFGRLGALTILSALPWKRKYMDLPASKDHEGVDNLQIG